MSLPFFFSLGDFNVAIIDVVVLIALIIAIIVGSAKGFAKQLFGMLGFVAALVGAFFLAQPVTEFVKTSFPQATEMVHGWILAIPGLGDVGHLTPETAQEVLNNSTIPAFLHPLIINIVQTSGGLDITPMLTTWAMTAIVFVLLVVILLILITIAKKLFTWIANLKFIKPLDKVLGAVFSLAITSLIIIIILLALTIFASGFVTALLTPTLSDGTLLDSISNKAMTFVMQQPLVQNLLSMMYS